MCYRTCLLNVEHVHGTHTHNNHFAYLHILFNSSSSSVKQVLPYFVDVINLNKFVSESKELQTPTGS